MHIAHPSQFQIGKNSRGQLKEPKDHFFDEFLMRKFKKSHQGTRDLRIL